MEQFDHLEVAQEAVALLKAGNTNGAAAFLRKLAADFGTKAFAADLRDEKAFYAEELGLSVADIEWMACTLEGNAPQATVREYPANHLVDVRAQKKLAMCIKLARECSRDSWQDKNLTPAVAKELRALRKEAMRDARYWRGLV